MSAEETSAEVVEDKAIVDDGAAAKANNGGGGDKGPASNEGGERAAKDGDKDSTLADGKEADTKAPPSDWPEDWRQRLAKDDKNLLKMLERLDSPRALLDKARNAEKKLSERAAGPKKPGKDAKPEELAAYRKEAGLPEKPEAYIEALKIPDGRTLGDDDRPVAESFVKAAHDADFTQEQVNATLGWYYQHLEQIDSAQVERDDAFKVQSRDELRDEWGPEFQKNVNAINHLFGDAPEGVRDAIFGGRTADGTKIGDDPRILRWLSNLSRELNPAATVIPAGVDTAKTLEDEIRSIEKDMADKNSGYYQDDAKQQRYRDLITARQRQAARK